jgi:hypothetical protein
MVRFDEVPPEREVPQTPVMPGKNSNISIIADMMNTLKTGMLPTTAVNFFTRQPPETLPQSHQKLCHSHNTIYY